MLRKGEECRLSSRGPVQQTPGCVGMELRDTDLGTGSVGRPGEVTAVGKIARENMGCEKGVRKPSGESTEPKIKYL